MNVPATLYNLGSGSWLARANGAAAQTAAIQLHALREKGLSYQHQSDQTWYTYTL